MERNSSWKHQRKKIVNTDKWDDVGTKSMSLIIDFLSFYWGINSWSQYYRSFTEIDSKDFKTKFMITKGKMLGGGIN